MRILFIFLFIIFLVFVSGYFILSDFSFLISGDYRVFRHKSNNTVPGKYSIEANFSFEYPKSWKTWVCAPMTYCLSERRITTGEQISGTNPYISFGQTSGYYDSELYNEIYAANKERSQEEWYWQANNIVFAEEKVLRERKIIWEEKIHDSSQDFSWWARDVKIISAELWGKYGNRSFEIVIPVNNTEKEDEYEKVLEHLMRTFHEDI